MSMHEIKEHNHIRKDMKQFHDFFSQQVTDCNKNTEVVTEYYTAVHVQEMI